tara:strand:- start:354 stop:986 length:633 start_codon:yes stop_codon:yes gene_type:complete
MKLSKKQNKILDKLIIFLCVIVVVSLLYNFFSKQSTNNNVNNSNSSNENNYSTIDSEGSKNDHIENFMAYPNQQMFCPNIFNSKSSFWTKLPEKYGNGLMAKFCCTSCYYLVSEEIYCGNNKDGLYKICKLKEDDIENLKQYYNSKQNLDFEFPEQKLNELKNLPVLKMKNENTFYPIQIIMTLDKLKTHENDPTLANQLYKDTYKCSNE